MELQHCVTVVKINLCILMLEKHVIITESLWLFEVNENLRKVLRHLQMFHQTKRRRHLAKLLYGTNEG